MATKYEKAVQAADTLNFQLQEARETLAARVADVERLTKELASTKSASDSWYKQATASKDEVEQVHCLLDALPSAPARKGASNEYGQATNFNLMTRLAAWMAVRP